MCAINEHKHSEIERFLALNKRAVDFFVPFSKDMKINLVQVDVLKDAHVCLRYQLEWWSCMRTLWHVCGEGHPHTVWSTLPARLECTQRSSFLKSVHIRWVLLTQLVNCIWGILLILSAQLTSLFVTCQLQHVVGNYSGFPSTKQLCEMPLGWIQVWFSVKYAALAA